MAEPTLVQIFGTGATQSATTLTILKADLASAGLTPSALNTGESLLLAVALQAKANLTDAARETNIDQNVAVVIGFGVSTVTRNNSFYARNTISIEVDKALPGIDIIDPDDY